MNSDSFTILKYKHINNTFSLFILCFFIFISSNIALAKPINSSPNVRLKISTATAERNTRIYYTQGKTTNFDNGYDGSLFGGVALSFALYTQLVSDKNGKKLGIQTVPQAYEKMVIPIGLIISANQEITFSATIENFPENLEVYLEDRVNNLFINLSKGTHNHTITKNTNGVGQFFLHTSFTGIPTPPSTATWTGNTNNDWHIFSNWFSNTVPSATSDIIIPADLNKYPTANSAVTFKSLTLHSGASFIPKDKVTGNITYKRMIPDTKWHLISSPVLGENTQNIIQNEPLATGLQTNIGLANFSNNGNTPWIYATKTSNNDILSGKGMSVKLTTPKDFSFTGRANTSSVSYPISTGSRNNFNLVGNPFTAYINSQNFALSNTNVLESQTIWIWNGSYYETYNANNPIEIAPGQAFFVEAISNENIIFDASNQKHQTIDTFKRPQKNPSFELFVTDEKNTKSTKVFYVENKTTGFDNGYDSKIFGGTTSSNFEVFTELITKNKQHKNQPKLAIQTLPTSKIEELIIPIGLNAKKSQKITFSIHKTNFPENIQIYLEDRINNTFTNISTKKHPLILENNTKSSGRFYIHTTTDNLEKNNIQKKIQKISIYKSANNTLIITGLENQKTQKVSLKIFSILGKKMLNKQFKAMQTNIIEIPKMAKGIYIVELHTDLGKINKKIIFD
ncbi:T9SS type A sorting domain-containing protein [Tenacibaculum piscium]|uniref:T9SS type A sorting domain-containing protein n=1 Tax=Tenacibaculum piscium TaxID=1458515 RepID=UPI001F40DD0B|nr:T9SS type A sorting domain-containing protein [Tenacibaculum piscium]